MPTYKLTYFDARGRAEPIRLLFAAGGIEYEDIRVSGEQWMALKPNTPFGHLPTLDVDGTVISESWVIARFVAKQAGLAGNTVMEQTQADMVVDGVKEMFGKIITMFFEKDETKKGELQKEFGEKTLPTFLGNLEKLASSNGYFVGDKLTWADVQFFNFTDMIHKGFPDALNGYDKLNKVVANAKSKPGIAKWLKERPESAF